MKIIRRTRIGLVDERIAPHIPVVRVQRHIARRLGGRDDQVVVFDKMPPVRTLADMTLDEKLELERRYNARIVG